MTKNLRGNKHKALKKLPKKRGFKLFNPFLITLFALVLGVAIFFSARAVIGASGPLNGSAFYRDPNSPAANQAKIWRNSRPADAMQMDKIAAQPKAIWMGNWTPNSQQTASDLVNRATAANTVAAIVAYNIPGRDCGSFSAGGAASHADYRTWIDGLAAGIGNKKTVVILEPDAIPLWDCLDAQGKQARIDSLKYAIDKLKTNSASLVYVDIGHSHWLSAKEAANRLQQVDITNADGFSLNVSNFNTTEDETKYGTQLSQLLGGKHFVIDTSRNGLGSNGQWCNPDGRALGEAPSTNTRSGLVDAYMWIKGPGESDGTCNGGPSAGTWWPTYALGLAQRSKLSVPSPTSGPDIHGGNVTVDFNKPIRQLVPYAFSGTISTYGQKTIVSSDKQRANLGSLGLGLYRIPLQWNGGNIISSAGGGPKNVSGDSWINNIFAFGGHPMVVIGGSKDNNFTPSDAANLVHHFNSNPNTKITYWVVGNEPSNSGMNMQAYCTLFNSTADAMRAQDPTIKIVGPAWAFFEASALNAFLQCAGNKVDVIDYHHYGMGTTFQDNATALSQTKNWEDEINQIRAMISQIVPNRSDKIEIQVGEYNWAWRTQDGYQGWNGDDRFYQAVNTVWSASIAGHIMIAGGRGHQYSDQNGALGITFEQTADATHFGQTLNDPMPIYHGLRMFSGGKLFRGFGSAAVATSTSLPDVEVFASTNQKNIVLINKSPIDAKNANVGMGGVLSGAADVWQTNKDLPFADPKKITTATINNGALHIDLPPYSVTTLVINESVSGPTNPAPISNSVLGSQSSKPRPVTDAGPVIGVGGKCLDDKRSGTQPENTIWLYTCNNTKAQQWTPYSDSSIRLMSGKYCLDVKAGSTSPESLVVLNKCNSAISQRWEVRTDGSIVNPHSGLCLDDKHSVVDNGNPIWIYVCNNSAAQKWSAPKWAIGSRFQLQ